MRFRRTPYPVIPRETGSSKNPETRPITLRCGFCGEALLRTSHLEQGWLVYTICHDCPETSERLRVLAERIEDLAARREQERLHIQGNLEDDPAMPV